MLRERVKKAKEAKEAEAERAYWVEQQQVCSFCFVDRWLSC